MANAERRPGILENGSYFFRNVEATIAGLAYFFGAYGVATLAAIRAVIDHAAGNYFKQRRLHGA